MVDQEQFYELKEKLEKNIFVNGIDTYNIIEYSDKSGEYLQTVGMLEAEIEDIVVILLDENGIVKNFLMTSVKDNGVLITNEFIKIELISGSYTMIKPIR
jgi:hypothetical protein